MSHLGRIGVLWERPNGYFLAVLSSCRKADLHQLGERVGVARSLSPGLGPCWPWRRRVQSSGVTGFSSAAIAGEIQKRGNIVGSSLGRMSGEEAVGFKAQLPASRTCL